MSARALADISAIRAHLADLSPRVAADTTTRLRVAIASLATFPNRGRRGLEPGTRELISVPPYIIVYTVGQIVEVARVWHSAQDRS